MADPISYLEVLEGMGRSENFDAPGGGTIIRQFYCEPYTAHKAVATALKGSIVPSGGIYKRQKPHQDPLYGQYYCSDVKVDPWAKEAVTGSAAKAFVPSTDVSVSGTQYKNIISSLNAFDDFDYGQIIDFAALSTGAGPRMSAAEDAVGKANNTTSPPYTSYGRCGAIITATYHPLIFLDGISSGQDPFDYCDPQWTAEIISTQTGRSLFFYNPYTPSLTSGGLSDTYAKPETIWRFTIRRLMVPFLPQLTAGLYQSKINSASLAVGNLDFPHGTLCFEKMDNEKLMGPDGTTWYGLTLHFKVRMLWDQYYDGGLKTNVAGWVDWNHQYGIPTARVFQVQTGGAGYYPVIWNTSIAQGLLFGGGPGTSHNLYLSDADIAPGGSNPIGGGVIAGNPITGSLLDLFSVGNRPLQ